MELSSTYRNSHDPGRDGFNAIKKDHENEDTNGAIELQATQCEYDSP